MRKFTSEDHYRYKDRVVFILKDQGITAGEMETLKNNNTLIQIDNTTYKIVGVETYATANRHKHTKFGVWVVKLDNMINVVNKYSHTPTPNDFYIGRGSPLGNPYTSIKSKTTKAQYIVDSRETSISKYKEYLHNQIFLEKNKSIRTELNKIYKLAKNNITVNLVCFCKPKSCHGDVIKELIENYLPRIK